jgi:Na+-translocating ferredoxin:NAD+ oxidoreductase subunit B
MPSTVFEELREQLDQYSLGFPPTKSGVELKILKKLFNEDEARLYLNLSLKLESPSVVADRVQQGMEDVSKVLDRMVEKGLIFRVQKGDSVTYAALPFAVGSWEFQVKTIDRELAQLFEQYLDESFGKEAVGKHPPMRTIPVNRSIAHSWPVAPYEDVRKIIGNEEKISVGNCICKVQQGLIDQACDKPLEVCFMFGSHADYMVERGIGRFVDQKEAIEIIDLCDEAGLVPQPFNAQKPRGLCNCCGHCCDVLRSIKLHPRPAEMVTCNYYVSVDPDLCVGCKTCVERCQMEAISIGSEDVATVDRERCIGCGLCVTTCTTGALSLIPKPERDRREPPVSARDYMVELAQKRGRSLVPLALTRDLHGPSK